MAIVYRASGSDRPVRFRMDEPGTQSRDSVDRAYDFCEHDRSGEREINLSLPFTSIPLVKWHIYSGQTNTNMQTC